MPRTRNIRPDLPSEERYASLTRDARLLYLQLPLVADDHGRLAYSLGDITEELYPFDALPAYTLQQWVNELCSISLVQVYQVGTVRYVAINDWRRLQKVDHPSPSKFPSPEEGQLVDLVLFSRNTEESEVDVSRNSESDQVEISRNSDAGMDTLDEGGETRHDHGQDFAKSAKSGAKFQVPSSSPEGSVSSLPPPVPPSTLLPLLTPVKPPSLARARHTPEFREICPFGTDSGIGSSVCSGQEETGSSHAEHDLDPHHHAQPEAEPAPRVPLDPPRSDPRVRQVWDAYCADTGKNRGYQFDAKRRGKITQALRDYPLDDVLDAVRGWRCIPFHAGDNAQRRPVNELTLLLRDAEHIEKFRVAFRDAHPTPIRTDDLTETEAKALRVGLLDRARERDAEAMAS